MLRLKTTVAGCLALSAIGGIIACSSQMAKSGGDAKPSSNPNTASATADSAARMPVPSARDLAKADEPAPAAGKAAQNTSLAGSVQIAGSPVSGATVTLYAAGTGASSQLAQVKTDGDGAFKLDGGQAPEGGVFYVVAKGGTPKAAGSKGPNDAIGLMALLGTSLPKTVTVNELTTVASTFTARDSSRENRFPGTRLDCGLPPGMFQTWWILRRASGAKRYLTRSTAP